MLYCTLSFYKGTKLLFSLQSKIDCDNMCQNRRDTWFGERENTVNGALRMAKWSAVTPGQATSDKESQHQVPSSAFCCSSLVLYPKCWGSEVFWILEYFHIHNDIFWRWDPSPNTKSIYVSYTHYIRKSEGNFIITFNDFVLETKFVYVEPFYCPL